MKRLLLLPALALSMFCATAQRLFDDFENIHFVTYWERSGTLDSSFTNPSPNLVNPSAKCAKYIRNHALNYDFLKMLPDSVIDVRPYLGITAVNKLKLHILTSAPTNTTVEIQMGKKGNPDTSFFTTTHSVYRAFTITKNQWEELTFNFIQYVDTVNIKPWEIDKIVLLISPNDTNYTDSMKFTRDTVYFDNLRGPEFTNMGIDDARQSRLDLGEIFPNPVQSKATLIYRVKSPGYINGSIYDMLGNKVKDMPGRYQAPGEYKEEISTADLSPGIYYYRMDGGGSFKVRRMVVIR